MDGGNDSPFVEEGDGGMEFGRAHAFLFQEHLFLKGKMAAEFPRPRDIFIEPCKKRIVALPADREEHAPLRADRHIPDGVMGGLRRHVGVDHPLLRD